MSRAEIEALGDDGLVRFEGVRYRIFGLFGWLGYTYALAMKAAAV